MISKVNNESGLILDPEAVSFFLMQASFLDAPRALNSFGISRALGYDVLNNKDFNNKDRRNEYYVEVFWAQSRLSGMLDATQKSHQAVQLAQGDKIIAELKTTLENYKKLFEGDIKNILNDEYSSDSKAYFDGLTSIITPLS